MKCISLRLFLALLTFFIGISLTAYWMLDREILSVPPPKSEIIRATSFIHDSQIPLSEKKFWEKEVLRRFKELPLAKLPDSIDESYRLTLLPTFDAPVIVRIWRSGDDRFLVTKKLSGQGGFGIKEFGKLSYEKTQSLTEGEWITFIKFLDQAFFWDMPPIDGNQLFVEDGAEWVIEGAKGEMFHEVHRITPSPEFRAGCNYLLKLSRLETEYEGY